MDNDSLYFVGVRFPGSEKSYYFSTTESSLPIGSLVVLSTINGVEMATTSTEVKPLSAYQNGLELKPILRLPDERDIADHKENLARAKWALDVTRGQIERLGLAMDLIDANYILDGSKITITYTSPEKRVDFRELLRELAPVLACRIELRQIAARDKAKMVGGIGMCGLPLCCTTFLTQFDGISIQRAKNQMLTLNIPKLSGHCGKLICCLTFEDDMYTEERKNFPHFGTVVKTPDGDYKVDGMNIISRTVKLVNDARDDYKTYPLEDVQAMLNGTYRKREEPKKDEMPDFQLGGRENRGRENSYGGMHPDRQDKGEYASTPKEEKENRSEHRHGRDRNDRRNRNNQNRNERKEQNQRPRDNQNNQNKQGEKGNRDNRNRHHHHHRGHGNKGGNQE